VGEVAILGLADSATQPAKAARYDLERARNAANKLAMTIDRTIR